MASKDMKKCSTLLFIREMQINERYPFMPIRMATIKKSTNIKCRRSCGEKGTFYTVVGMQTNTATMENSVEIP